MLKTVNVALIVIMLTTFVGMRSYFWKKDTKTMSELEVVNNLQQYGIDVIAPTNADFNGYLIQYVGGGDNLIPVVETAKPFAVFIRNNSPKDVVGVSLRWQFIKSNGATKVSRQMASTPGVLMGIKPLDPWMIGKTSLINSNSIKFFSLFNSVEQSVINTNKSFKNPAVKYSPSLNEIQQILSVLELQKGTKLRDTSRIVISVDGIFFSDGTFVGEDQNLFFDSINGQIQAKKDFIKFLRDAKLAKKDDSEILNRFVSDVQAAQARSSEMRSPAGYLNNKDAFEQNYRNFTNDLQTEIVRKKSHFADSDIIKQYLSTNDSDFVSLQKGDCSKHSLENPK